MVDFLIIGQGIAGTCLALRLINEGHSVLIMDNDHRHSSSVVAAGIINPITGRYYTKSWMMDELQKEIRDFYFGIQEKWGISFIRETTVIRTFHDAKSENSWYARMDKPGYADYMAKKPDLGKYQDIIHKPFGFGEVRQAFQVDLSLFLHSFRSKYEKNMVYDHFAYDQIQVKNDGIFYQGIEAKNIVFSEGYRVLNNPYFNHLPFQPVKGEILIVRIEGPVPGKILRDKMFICPIGKDLYWVGSGYDWKDLDEVPTQLHKDKMIHFLDNILTEPYEIIDHKAGVRPSTKDRRPLIGHHPDYSNVFLFNGMGTKGTSLSPYWSKKMLHFLKGTYSLPAEVNLTRFEP